MKAMKASKAKLWAGVALCLALVLALALWLPRRGPADGESSETPVEAEAVSGGEEVPTRGVSLYFPGQGGRLYAEPREIPEPQTPEGGMAAVVSALIEGPKSESLRAPLPGDLKVGRVYAIGEGVYAVDLQASEQEGPGGIGSRREILALYSIVNSVVANFSEAERLLVVWDGRQPTTFAGHIDTSRPLLPNVGLVAASP